MLKTAILLTAFLFILRPLSAAEKITFWDGPPKKGCNCFNEKPTEQWFRAASAAHIEWVRLAYDKWDSESRDFLIGDASKYRGLVKKDLEKLKEVLAWADKYGLKVVIAPLSLPGCRWTQNNGNRYDDRLWRNFKYHEMSARFWRDLATELKGYDHIVAYNILNEPVPEYKTNLEEQTEIGDVMRYVKWREKYGNSPRDLPLFYGKVIASIRTVDASIPVMVDSGYYAQPNAYYEWPEKLSDTKVLYAFHMYEPYEFTSPENHRKGNRFAYPGKISFGRGSVDWNRKTVEDYFRPFFAWTEKNGIPANRIVAAEFGCMRRNKGAAQYFEDVLSVFESRKIHWAFYSFREDGWDGYDYELGDSPLPNGYWKAKEQGNPPALERKNNPLFDVIRKRLEK